MVTTDEPFDLGFELGELSELAKQAQWDSLNAYGDLLTRVTPEGWARRLADLNVRYCEELLKGTHSLTDRVGGRGRAGHAPTEPRPGGTAAEGPRRMPMSLHAQVGEPQRVPSACTTRSACETEISFLASDFTSSDGESIRPSVTVRSRAFFASGRWRSGSSSSRCARAGALSRRASCSGARWRCEATTTWSSALTVWADE